MIPSSILPEQFDPFAVHHFTRFVSPPPRSRNAQSSCRERADWPKHPERVDGEQSLRGGDCVSKLLARPYPAST
ncbi:uncharacterized protein SCHCODRAFT_02503310 [Schizophyllum commune H4-8]|uniref:uncharacterized protein n=1 Tax=Schizophyllum commune (strain H4-8 / FGSC 9210) TaxID=578458 RepID=UPI00215E5AF4|nr:uncharacterized protein SCHCODRAFT_02503310 [Schizophyllum commune H4-8]KAI5892182.1 hypothetical protein SCHCODRAFT_02503310 [Schizophyllum commune H4-8]